MNTSRKARSYSRYNKHRRGVVFSVLRFVVIVFILYEGITCFLLSSYTVKSDSMEPDIHKNQKVLAVPFFFGLQIPFTGKNLPAIRSPERGDIVVLTPPNRGNYPWYTLLGDSLVRFFTLQKKTLLPASVTNRTSQIAVKRIIGIPGDTVKMENFTVFINPPGTARFITESTLVPYRTPLRKETLPEGWSAQEPFDGAFPPVTLQEEQYFVLNDNRDDRNDSRFFGILPRKDIHALVILKYLPGLSLP